MASPSSPTGTHGNPDNSPNRPTTLVEGGASAYPTPANNVGGGRGWGDEGFLKGGTGKEPPGHIFVFQHSGNLSVTAANECRPETPNPQWAILKPSRIKRRLLAPIPRSVSIEARAIQARIKQRKIIRLWSMLQGVRTHCRDGIRPRMPLRGKYPYLCFACADLGRMNSRK